METLQRLRERQFVFVSTKAQQEFRNLLSSITVLRPIALAPYASEPPIYRTEARRLFELVADVRKSLIDYDRYREPYIYTGLIEQIKKTTNSISVSQPEAIFRMMNKLLVISKQLEKLIESLRS